MKSSTWKREWIPEIRRLVDMLHAHGVAVNIREDREHGFELRAMRQFGGRLSDYLYAHWGLRPSDKRKGYLNAHISVIGFSSTYDILVASLRNKSVLFDYVHFLAFHAKEFGGCKVCGRDDYHTVNKRNLKLGIYEWAVQRDEQV